MILHARHGFLDAVSAVRGCLEVQVLKIGKTIQNNVKCHHISSLLRHSFDIFSAKMLAAEFCFKKNGRPKNPEENLENLCVFVQGYTWAIGALGQFGAGSLKNLITSSQPWQGCR